jgi:hypothetical protein
MVSNERSSQGVRDETPLMGTRPRMILDESHLMLDGERSHRGSIRWGGQSMPWRASATDRSCQTAFEIALLRSR